MNNKLINGNISRKVLMIGVYHKHNAAGGMASVIQYYERYFDKLQYIPTWRDKSILVKLYFAIRAYVILLFKLIFDRKIEIIHIHSAADKSFKRKSAFSKLAKIFNKKIILHIHGSRFKDFYQEANNKQDILKKLQYANKIIVLSQSWKEWFIHIGIDPHKLIVLNNIVDYPVIKDVKKENQLKILFLGEIGHRKGIFDIIESIIQNKVLLEKEIILKVGGNKETNKLVKLINDFNLSSFVKFEGFVSGEKKVELLNWADILILPSYNEGLPIAILEAMSYKNAIISTQVGGIPEIVKPNQNGILVKPGNLEDIYKAISFFINNKTSLTAYGKQSKEIVKPFFPMAVLSDLSAIYSDLLKDN